MSVARKLHAWRDRERACVARVVQDVYVQWRSAWGLQVPCGDALCMPAELPDDGAGWQALEGVGAWMQWSAAARSELDALFGAGSARTPLALEAAAACKQDAMRRLRALWRDASPGGTTVAFGKWSGAAVVQLTCGSALRMDAAAVARLLEGRLPPAGVPTRLQPALSPLLEAAGRSPARIEARLADCDLELAMLQRLCIGDVIRLPHALDAPLTVHGPDQRSLFTGFLARSRGRKVVELAPAAVDVPTRGTP